MLLEALSALTLAAAAPADAPPAVGAVSPTESLLTAIRSRCPTMEPKVRAAGPDELLRLEHGFRIQLSPRNRSRLEKARHTSHARCGAAPGGAPSCQANADLSAIVDSDLVGAFADYVCKQETAATAPH